MSAQSINIFTIDFPDPKVIDYNNNHFSTLPLNESFQYPISSNIETLTSKKVERGNDPYGLLFVPDLSSDGCREEEQKLLPSNVTRLANLPSTDTQYALIAFAPWFNASCMTQYFESARRTPLKAFIVYQPGTTNSMPPVMNDDSWLLNDGGSWMTANQFPTYALSSMTGNNIAKQLGQYSGNVTSAPNGDAILASDPQFKATDYVRLWATVNTDPGSQLPSLWVFLLIVLGLLILAFGGTSLAMHFVQRRRRNNLRRRIVNGEVDLEALGVKRLTVPRDYLEKLPLYTYSAAPTLNGESAQTHNLPSLSIEPGQQPWLSRTISAPTAALPPVHNTASFAQATCSICLDDFDNESQVRELPCRHIYHADCIDTFLISNSSLCPLCKQSVLPTGYCPETITNIMVRRERMIRRRQAANPTTTNVTDAQSLSGTAPEAEDAPHRPVRAFGSLGSRAGGAFGGSRRIFSAPERTQRPPDIEMAATSQQITTMSEITPAPVRTGEECEVQPPPTATQHRSEWARERAMSLLGNRHIPSDAEEEDRIPGWKRGMRRIFPGFQ